MKVSRLDFAHDPALEKLVRDKAEAGAMSIQDVIDACTIAGFDGRAVATGIGTLLMDGILQPASPTSRVSGSTVVKPVRPS